MQFPMSFLKALPFLAIAAALVPAQSYAAGPCRGHQLLQTPRPAASCRTIVPEIFVSPDRAFYAEVLPVDVSLYATPDMESRVVIRRGSDTLNSKDFSSPRGANGYYVYAAQWSPDSRFFVFSLTSSGGHQPWSFPIMVYSRVHNRFAHFSDMIGGRPTLSGHFAFSGGHSLMATTWKRPGALDEKAMVRVDLEKAFARLKPSSH